MPLSDYLKDVNFPAESYDHWILWQILSLLIQKDLQVLKVP